MKEVLLEFALQGAQPLSEIVPASAQTGIANAGSWGTLQAHETMQDYQGNAGQAEGNLWRLCWVVFRKLHSEREVTPIPICIRLAWYMAIPLHEVDTPAQ